MNILLKRLGISREVQAFFHAEKLHFDYGDLTETYDQGFHFIPTTSNIWTAGNIYAPEVILTSSAMEAICWYAVHEHKYRDTSALAFVSLGNLPCAEQIAWLRRSFKNRKYTLAFGNSLLDRATDIWVGTRLSGREAVLRWQKRKIGVSLNGTDLLFNESQCTLNAIEQAFGFRTGIRTSKPHLHSTFLHQLQNGPEQ